MDDVLQGIFDEVLNSIEIWEDWSAFGDGLQFGVMAVTDEMYAASRNGEILLVRKPIVDMFPPFDGNNNESPAEHQEGLAWLLSEFDAIQAAMDKVRASYVGKVLPTKAEYDVWFEEVSRQITADDAAAKL